jgi:tRNA (guanine-N7-)-methyltransferase
VFSIDNEVDKQPYKKIRSYVLREGRMSQAQRRAIDAWWPLYGLSYSAGLIDIPAVFSDSDDAVNSRTTVLDIGFGMGDALLEAMEQNPSIRFIGVEVHRPGIGHLMSLAAGKSLSNLRIYRHDVTEVLSHCIPDESLDKVQIFFPDPWPKKKHHKRRLIQSGFIKLLAVKLKTGGLLHLVTDWPDYAEQMREVVNESVDITESDRAIERPTTKYEKRAVRLGHKIFELVCTKT